MIVKVFSFCLFAGSGPLPLTWFLACIWGHVFSALQDHHPKPTTPTKARPCLQLDPHRVAVLPHPIKSRGTDRPIKASSYLLCRGMKIENAHSDEMSAYE
jgi:hypothetical protein